MSQIKFGDRTSVGGAVGLYWSGQVSLAMGDNELGEHDVGVIQLSDGYIVGMMHCHRVRFVRLTGPTCVVPGDGATVLAHKAREETSTSL